MPPELAIEAREMMCCSQVGDDGREELALASVSWSVLVDDCHTTPDTATEAGRNQNFGLQCPSPRQL